MLNRRDAITAAGAAFAMQALPAWAAPSGLTSLTTRMVPIDYPERKARIAKAQALMRANGIGAVLIESGSSLDYFTGVKWWRSERLTCAVLPVEGRPCIVTPYFEEPSIREGLEVPGEVLLWQEDENPLTLVASFLKSRQLDRRPVGVEETVRFFASDGLARVLPSAKLVSANPVVRGCRMIKTPAEIALMQAAADVTVAAIKNTVPRIETGMTPKDIAAMIDASTVALGGVPEFALVLLGEASAYPHGTVRPQRVANQEIILMDCGCTVGGYQSDISRTVVLGGATAAQRKVFGEVQQGQQIAFAAAKPGAPAGGVDDAVRAHYEQLGYGPRYQRPGLPHRTGHGIGMDGHEPVNLVHGETTRLAPGMCFSNEPGLYIPGAFGVRIEDCFHMTEAGPVWFSQPQRSIEYPAD
jgi:Xaa-Pro dipeptidase